MEKKLPLLQANIRISAPSKDTFLDTMMYSHEQGYGFAFSPNEIKGLPFRDTMQRFSENGNSIQGMVLDINVIFEVTGIEYGSILDKLNKDPLKTITLEDYVSRGMPEEI